MVRVASRLTRVPNRLIRFPSRLPREDSVWPDLLVLSSPVEASRVVRLPLVRVVRRVRVIVPPKLVPLDRSRRIRLARLETPVPRPAMLGLRDRAVRLLVIVRCLRVLMALAIRLRKLLILLILQFLPN